MGNYKKYCERNYIDDLLPNISLKATRRQYDYPEKPKSIALLQFKTDILVQ